MRLTAALASSALRDAGSPRELVLGVLDPVAQQVAVEPVVPAVRVRRLDRAQPREPLFGVGGELRDVLEQHLRRRQAADEQLQEEGLACARLDRLEPSVERGTAVAR